MQWFCYGGEDPIRIRSTTRWISLVIVLICRFRYSRHIILHDIFSRSSSGVYEELISTLDGKILRVSHAFTVDKVENTLPTSCEIYLPIIIDEVSTSHSPFEVREEVSPRRPSHMHMDEITLVLMQMDAILRLHVGRDIATRSLFHVDISTEVPHFPVNEYCEVRMIVDLIWSGKENIRDSCCEGNENQDGENFDKEFHGGIRCKT